MPARAARTLAAVDSAERMIMSSRDSKFSPVADVMPFSCNPKSRRGRARCETIHAQPCRLLCTATRILQCTYAAPPLADPPAGKGFRRVKLTLSCNRVDYRAGDHDCAIALV
ncbi:hypothetical protein GCM10017643_09680 [Ancylobacter dichloromethanicus]|uniref:Uncharacterized protein n=1 Tax=Ancylobacter dichloromethanicus TaxID=518825 RepID=A0A9W6J7S0_9HYPH|nr:hypothetical protein GCM10017643_09680 [Ancylobacter dichloromethanicus]